MTDIRSVQAAAWANKLAKGFNTGDVPLEFCYLQEEVSEAFSAWRKGKGREHLGEELADAVLFLVALAEMNGIDLQAAVERKLAINAGRVYRPGPHGIAVRVDPAEASAAPHQDEARRE